MKIQEQIPSKVDISIMLEPVIIWRYKERLKGIWGSSIKGTNEDWESEEK